jgi:hypothetical protein
MPCVLRGCEEIGHIREALECGSDRATALGGSGKVIVAQLSKHHAPRVVAIPPPSQSGGSTPRALQSAAHETSATFPHVLSAESNVYSRGCAESGFKMSREASDACANHGAFREALECGSDRATALGGSGKVIVAQLSRSITRRGSSRFHRPPKAAARRRAHSKVLRTKRAAHLHAISAESHVCSGESTVYSDESTVYSGESHVYSDESHVYSDESHVYSAESHVYSDESHVYSDESHVYSDESHVYSDESHAYSDESHVYSGESRVYQCEFIVHAGGLTAYIG